MERGCQQINSPGMSAINSTDMSQALRPFSPSPPYNIACCAAAAGDRPAAAAALRQAVTNGLTYGTLQVFFHCLSLTFHCISTAFHWPSAAFHHCLSLTFYCLFHAPGRPIALVAVRRRRRAPRRPRRPATSTAAGSVPAAAICPCSGQLARWRQGLWRWRRLAAAGGDQTLKQRKSPASPAVYHAQLTKLGRGAQESGGAKQSSIHSFWKGRFSSGLIPSPPVLQGPRPHGTPRGASAAVRHPGWPGGHAACRPRPQARPAGPRRLRRAAGQGKALPLACLFHCLHGYATAFAAKTVPFRAVIRCTGPTRPHGSQW